MAQLCSRLLSRPPGRVSRRYVPKPEIAVSMRLIGTAAQLNTAWKMKNSSTARIAGPDTGCSTISSSRVSARLRIGSR